MFIGGNLFNIIFSKIKTLYIFLKKNIVCIIGFIGFIFLFCVCFKNLAVVTSVFIIIITTLLVFTWHFLFFDYFEKSKNKNKNKFIVFWFGFSHWVRSPVSLVVFTTLLPINSFLYIVSRPYYFVCLIYWANKLYKYSRNNSILEVKPTIDSFFFETDNSILYLYYWQIVVKPYFTSFDVMYYISKRFVNRRNNSKVDTIIRVVNSFIVFCWCFLIKTITGFGKNTIVDTYNWSIRFNNINDLYNYRGIILGNIIPIYIFDTVKPTLYKKIYKTCDHNWVHNPQKRVDDFLLKGSCNVLNLAQLLRKETFLGTLLYHLESHGIGHMAVILNEKIFLEKLHCAIQTSNDNTTKEDLFFSIFGYYPVGKFSIGHRTLLNEYTEIYYDQRLALKPHIASWDRGDLGKAHLIASIISTCGVSTHHEMVSERWKKMFEEVSYHNRQLLEGGKTQDEIMFDNLKMFLFEFNGFCWKEYVEVLLYNSTRTEVKDVLTSKKFKILNSSSLLDFEHEEGTLFKDKKMVTITPNLSKTATVNVGKTNNHTNNIVSLHNDKKTTVADKLIIGNKGNGDVFG